MTSKIPRKLREKVSLIDEYAQKREEKQIAQNVKQFVMDVTGAYNHSRKEVNERKRREFERRLDSLISQIRAIDNQDIKYSCCITLSTLYDSDILVSGSVDEMSEHLYWSGQKEYIERIISENRHPDLKDKKQDKTKFEF